MNKIYLSGPITNVPNYVESFKLAEKKLGEIGFTDIINPVNIKHKNKDNWELCMIEDIKVLIKECDKIFLLPFWRHSKGANIEVLIAKALNMEIWEISYEYNKIFINRMIYS